MLACGLWGLLCIGATELWYRRHEGKDEGFVRWSVTLPEAKPGFERIEMPPKILELLKYDRGVGAKWQDKDGSDWTAYFFRWDGKTVRSIMAARQHSPEVCLPASGLQRLSGPQLDYLQAGSLKLPMQKSTYFTRDGELYVFYCVWQDGDERRKEMRSMKPADRLLLPIEGRRRIGQQSLEIIIRGLANMSEAEQAVRQRLPAHIQVEPRPVSATLSGEP